MQLVEYPWKYNISLEIAKRKKSHKLGATLFHYRLHHQHLQKLNKRTCIECQMSHQIEKKNVGN